MTLARPASVAFSRDAAQAVLLRATAAWTSCAVASVPLPAPDDVAESGGAMGTPVAVGMPDAVAVGAGVPVGASVGVSAGGGVSVGAVVSVGPIVGAEGAVVGARMGRAGVAAAGRGVAVAVGGSDPAARSVPSGPRVKVYTAAVPMAKQARKATVDRAATRARPRPRGVPVGAGDRARTVGA